MKKGLILFVATLSLVACGGTPAKRVLFIGSDGMSAAVLRRSDVKAPTLRGLMARGAWSLKARTILPSSSAANWASMFQCSGPEQNGYNEWNSRKPIMPPAATDANGRFPDIFYRFRAARPNAKIGYAYGWQGMPFVVDTNVCDFVVQTNAAQEVVLDWIRSAKPDLMAVVFSPPDGAGHKYGWRSPEYVKAVEAVDADIGRVIAAYEEAGLFSETLVVFTSDHGGIEKKHGGTTLDEMERPLFFAGPGVKRGYEIPWVTLCPDVGATIAYVLGIPPARVWTGRVIDDIFEHGKETGNVHSKAPAAVDDARKSCDELQKFISRRTSVVNHVREMSVILGRLPGVWISKWEAVKPTGGSDGGAGETDNLDGVKLTLCVWKDRKKDILDKWNKDNPDDQCKVITEVIMKLINQTKGFAVQPKVHLDQGDVLDEIVLEFWFAPVASIDPTPVARNKQGPGRD